MQSEVRKVLNGFSYFEVPLWWQRVDAAEHADAARRDEPVLALRQAVAELVEKWRTCFLPTPVAEIVRDLLTELNAIIATNPDTVESQPATASGPSVTPADERIRAIAAQAVRDAMPDVLDGLAETHKERGWYGMADGIKRYAAKLRKERGA